MELLATESIPAVPWDRHLEDTSRTFALAIPLLPEPLRRGVTLAYLLFRVADTLEDAARWSPWQRVNALHELAALLAAPSTPLARARAAQWLASPPLDHPGYLRLLSDTPALLAAVQSLPFGFPDLVFHHVRRTVARMSSFLLLANGAGRVELDDLQALRAYCYAVAGIVGELLTDMFLAADASLAPFSRELRERAAAFGEGLQLVNVLKDASQDAREGRRYLPRGVAMHEVFALAHRDLAEADAYGTYLHVGRAHPGVIAFARLPVRLARATLDQLAVDGPGAKLSRGAVAAVLEELQRDLSAPRV